jgi:hypothetical protein
VHPRDGGRASGLIVLGGGCRLTICSGSLDHCVWATEGDAAYGAHAIFSSRWPVGGTPLLGRAAWFLVYCLWVVVGAWWCESQTAEPGPTVCSRSKTVGSKVVLDERLKVRLQIEVCDAPWEQGRYAALW